MEKAYSEPTETSKMKLLGLQLYQKETPTQVFPVKFLKFLKTTFFTEHLIKNTFFHSTPPVAASVIKTDLTVFLC